MIKFVLLLFSFCIITVNADAYYQSDNDTVTYRTPDATPSNNALQRRGMTPREKALSEYVLYFSVILFAMEFALIVLRKDISPNTILKFMLITLIITATLFLITAGYGGVEISPALGLLGTIAGYLLGKTDSNQTNTNNHS